ncbi:MAG: geranylgeranylglycerol-phosphate geranylgeranyltransferase [Candidatus Cloacimonetes bacterium]|nr:geranylgeranylglycerol-phosphate geranylgeranyltransferase [Candidatus Cloacimonadota bacterium]
MSYLKIIRPYNCLFVSVSVLFGAYFNSDSNHIVSIISAVISATLIAGGGYVINDFFDIKIDMINKPERILPAKKIKPRTAYLFAIYLFLSGIIFSFFTQNIYCVIIAIVNSLVLFFYAKILKKTLLVGNIAVAYAACSTFIYGSLSNGNLKNGLIAACFAFLYTLIREFIKDGEDIEGDIKHGARTLAIKVGKKNLVYISILPAFMMIIYSFYLLFSELIYFKTFLMFNIFISLPLILFIFYLLMKGNKQDFSKISLFMKIDMVILLIIIWIGRL